MKDKMYTLDCGKNTATLYNGEIVKTISHKEVLCLAGHLEAGSTLVGEYAHFGCPRKELSRAQPFTEDQLLKWYNDLRANNITLKLFPQQSTVRACISAFGVKKVKENGKLVKKVTKGDNTDPEAIYKIIKKHSNISLMNPPKSFGFDKVGNEGIAFKVETDEVLNWARGAMPKGYMDEDDQNTKWFMENSGYIYNNLSEATREIFEFAKYKVATTTKIGKFKKGDVKIGDLKIVQVMTVLALLKHPKFGNLRLREVEINGRKQMPSWKFIKKYVLRMSPFHLKGGVARSNIYYHGAKTYIRKAAKEAGLSLAGKDRGEFNEEEDKFFIESRTKYMNAVKELFFLFREMLENEEGSIGYTKQ